MGEDQYQESPVAGGTYMASFSNLRATVAPEPASRRVAADAHLSEALRGIPFERGDGSGYPSGGGGGLGGVLYGSEGGQRGRGYGFTKLRDERERAAGSREAGRNKKKRSGGGSGRGKRRPVFLPGLLLRKALALLEGLGFDLRWAAALLPAEEEARGESGGANATAQVLRADASGGTERALHHLVRASELGSPLAQTMVAQSLASGILPLDLGGLAAALPVAGNLTVPSDFAHGGPQLSRALVLWHSAAMGGSIEATLALAYRSLYSAGMGTQDEEKLILDRTLKMAATAEKVADMKKSGIDPMAVTDKRLPLSLAEEGDVPPNLHPKRPTAHYGLLGTCESALEYYQAAAELTMDELEASELRGKVRPAYDNHRLPNIHAHGGASSALAPGDKPHESEEALEYYRVRAHMQEPDLQAAWNMAEFHHYGYGGVKQDMKLALEYYRIAADQHSWEASGQVGLFYLWGMGMDESDQDMSLAYKYFKKATHGGYELCRKQFVGSQIQKGKKMKKKKRKKKDGEDEDNVSDYTWDEVKDLHDGWQGALCEKSSLNGMGLLYLFGVPMILAPNRGVAAKYFELASDMGDADASYNAAMLRLGWREKKFEGDEQVKWDEPSTSPENRLLKARDKRGLGVSDYSFVYEHLKRASSRGHYQAKYRLGVLLKNGISIFDPNTIDPDGKPAMEFQVIQASCQHSIRYFKYIAEQGPAVARRLRTAYKQYDGGDYESSLRNYLVAAEAGNVVAQINAAFLLEQGTCLGLSATDCTNASVRMWRAAARMGDAEASLHVGDFYYYGRLPGAGSKSDHKFGRISDAANDAGGAPLLQASDYGYTVGPYQWARYLLFPEDIIPMLRKKAVAGMRYVLRLASGEKKRKVRDQASDEAGETCSSGQIENGTCPASPELSVVDEDDHQSQKNLALAARYYRIAAEENDSPRANFNLAFMHEWGLGLAQDFPLAKRHYDLAASSKSGGVLAVQVALIAMDWHQRVVKWNLAWEEWKGGKGNSDEGKVSVLSGFDRLRWLFRGDRTETADTRVRAHTVETDAARENMARTPKQILLANAFSWEMIVFVLSFVAAYKLLRDRVAREKAEDQRTR